MSVTPRAGKRAATPTAATPTPAAKSAKRSIASFDDRVEAIAKPIDGKMVGRAQRWSLGAAVRHVASADGGRLAQVVGRCGAPDVYDGDEQRSKTTFCALCRIVCGQQLAGSAVKAIWAKFVAALGDDASAVTPSAVLACDLETLRAQAGLSRAKANAISALATHYENGELSDAALCDPALSEAQLSAKLTAVSGIGPWSVNMFSMFFLQRPDVFPTGDLGVRNGVASAFCLRGSGKKGGLDEKKDRERLLAAFAPYEPFRSVASWYMWRVVETPSFLED